MKKGRPWRPETPREGGHENRPEPGLAIKIIGRISDVVNDNGTFRNGPVRGSSPILRYPNSGSCQVARFCPPRGIPNAMDKPVLLTRDGLAKLERELAELRTTGRSEIAERIKYAKDFGDISENSEYDDAKNDQGMLEGRILVLENMLRNAVIIEEGAGNGVVGIGSAVEVKDEFGKQSFTIVGPAEVDVAEGRISMESP